MINGTEVFDDPTEYEEIDIAGESASSGLSAGQQAAIGAGCGAALLGLGGLGVWTVRRKRAAKQSKLQKNCSDLAAAGVVPSASTSTTTFSSNVTRMQADTELGAASASSPSERQPLSPRSAAARATRSPRAAAYGATPSAPPQRQIQ